LEQKMITTIDAFAQGENAHTPKIKNVRRVNKNSLIAAFDIEFPTGFVIRRAMLLERQGQRWIGLPEQSPWQPIFGFATREARDRFQSAILPIAEAAVFGGAL
jgi:hypothetical protein